MVLGCVGQLGDQSSNVARFAVLAAGWPEHVPGVDREPGLRVEPAGPGRRGPRGDVGQSDLVVAGGVEMMSRVPLGAARETGQPYGPRVLSRYDDFSSTRVRARRYRRAVGPVAHALDEYSAAVSPKAAAATDAGVFADHIVPVDVDGTPFTVDEGVRRGSSVETLAA